MSNPTFPSDPVSNGATAIQATIFNVVSADYIKIDASGLAAFIRDNKGVKGLPALTGNGTIPLEWQFFRRKDMAAGLAKLRNIVGVKTVVDVQTSALTFSPNLGKNIAVPTQIYRIAAHNWHPIQMELDNEANIVYWMHDSAEFSLLIDPETGTVVESSTPGELTNPLYEALGFLFAQTAANYPAVTPSLNAMSGFSPIG